MEVKHIAIRGKSYPACFSLRVATRAAEKLGSLDAIFEERPLQEAAEINLWLLSECLAAGKVYAEMEGKKTVEPPTQEALYDQLSIVDAGRAVALIMEASQRVTVELQTESEKNAVATQDH